MKRQNITVNQLIEQGYMIQDANLLYTGKAWELTPALLAAFTPAFTDLRSAQALCENIRIEKEALVQREKLERTRIEHTIARLKQFILVVADMETAAGMFHTLGIDDDLPNKNEDLVTKVMSTVVPHLADWDATPQEIIAAIKTEVTDGATEFADAVRDSIEKQAESTTATQDRDNKCDIYEDVLTQIRNFLYLMLPLERKDERLELYGFDVWGGEQPSEPGELVELPAAPTGLAVELRMVPSPFMLISCDEYGEHTGFDILRAETPAGVTEPPVMPEELFIKNTMLPLMDGEIKSGMKYWYQIRARNGEEVGDWSEVVGVEYK